MFTFRFFKVNLSLLERSKSSSLKHCNAKDDGEGTLGSILLKIQTDKYIYNFLLQLFRFTKS